MTTLTAALNDFTPGPWSASDAGEIYTSTGANPLDPCDVGDSEARANARLIAAAPALYEALQGLLKAYERACVDGAAGLNHETMEAEEMANIVLAQVRGEA